ncbi:protein kinase [Metarhizium rileyi]|uniref:EKC/KEOPS complex subunit BUD32 n=1 Tax=Metarhizium rileyi (strain RCEF 4871) TaxID=1649241 RepID=A0A167IV34_METRR|nr:protein kinase [Metarhizium rileyi RCEF 4871]
MKRTLRAFQLHSRTSLHLKQSVVFACLHYRGEPSEASRSRVWRRKITTPSIENFHRVPDATPIEEELLPGYRAEDYFPVMIGQTLDSRYSILCKLGCGVGSTVWLAKDVKYNSNFIVNLPHLILHIPNRVSRTSKYRAVKVCTRSTKGAAVPAQARQEVAVAEYLETAPVQEHPGRRRVRTALDSFTLNGPHGTHTCLVYEPQGMTFTELCDYLPESRLPKRMLQTNIQLLLISMDYLHKNRIVHTDISPNNILVGATEDTPFSRLEKDELARPVARKVLPDRTIYMSRPVPISDGKLILSDMGSARFGQETFKGDIMPDVYRAPEVILGMEWSSKVDLWSVGIWDLLEGKRLFHAKKDGVLDDEQHLAEMVSLMGNPPSEFLQRSEISARFFDNAGNWKGSTPIPDQSFESRITQVQGEDKDLLLGLVRDVLCWLPEQRPTAEEMAYDDFLMQAYFAGRSKD